MVLMIMIIVLMSTFFNVIFPYCLLLESRGHSPTNTQMGRRRRSQKDESLIDVGGKMYSNESLLSGMFMPHWRCPYHYSMCFSLVLCCNVSSIESFWLRPTSKHKASQRLSENKIPCKMLLKAHLSAKR